MKKSKILVPAVALLALGMAASTTATVAWFTATQNVTKSTDGVEITVNDASIGNNWYLVLEVSDVDAVDFTDKNGKTWAVANGVLVEASQSKTFDAFTLTPKIYKTRTGEAGAYVYSDETSANERKSIAAEDQTYEWQIQASDRARLTYTDPSSSFTTAFGDLFENKLRATIKLTVSTGGLSVTKYEAASYGASLTAYFSVSGQSTNATHSGGDSATGITDDYATDHVYGAIETAQYSA